MAISSLLTAWLTAWLVHCAASEHCEGSDCGDGSAYLQRKKGSKARGSLNATSKSEGTVTCGDRGTLVFDFSNPNTDIFKNSDVEIATDSGIFYRASLSSRASGCNGFAIWTRNRDKDDVDLRTCPQGPGTDESPYCNLLVVSEDGSTSSSIDDCANGGSKITLEFERPQEILSFKWWDNEESGTKFKWINADGGGSGQVNVARHSARMCSGREKLVEKWRYGCCMLQSGTVQ